MKWLFVIFVIATALVIKNTIKPTVGTVKLGVPFKVDNEAITKSRLELHTKKLKTYLQKNGFSSQYCFLVDMKIPSGKFRFFVIDVLKDSIVSKGLTTHGSGSIYNKDSLIFSNKPGSLSTSVGKYVVGNSYDGKFGLAFKLRGLEITNSKAYERFVVLHAHSCVPSTEVFPNNICESWGCPTVNPTYLQTLKKYIDKSEKPIMLWIYY